MRKHSRDKEAVVIKPNQFHHLLFHTSCPMGLAVVFLFLMGPWIIDKPFATLFITKYYSEVKKRHVVPALDGVFMWE